MKTTALSRLALLCSALPLAVSANDALNIHTPWVREVPPVADDSAGYMRIENPTDTDRTLVDAESEQFERAEFHESVEQDGLMRMRHHESLEIPAGGEVALEPGGYHLMLIGRRVDALQAGDQVDIRLIFDDGRTLDVSAPVSRDAPNGDDDDGGHHDHH